MTGDPNSPEPAVGDTVRCWDDEDQQYYAGTIRRIDRTGVAYVMCSDGIEAEVPTASLECNRVRYGREMWTEPRR